MRRRIATISVAVGAAALVPSVACQLAFPNVVRDEDDGGRESSTGAGNCQSTGPHLFCADFDQARVDLGWDDKSPPSPANGLATIQDDAAAVSPPYSMLVTVPTIPNDSFPAAGVDKEVQGVSGSARIAFDIRIDQLDLTTTARLHALTVYRSPSVGRLLQLTLSSDGTFLTEDRYEDGGDTHTVHPLSANLPVGTWVRVAIDIQGGDGGSGTATVRFDGAVVLAAAPIEMFEPSKPLPIFLGLNLRGGPSGPWRVRYDNYTLDSP